MTKSEMVAIAKALKTSGASDETKVEVAISMLNTGSFAENAKYTHGNFFWDSECSNLGDYTHVWLRKVSPWQYTANPDCKRTCCVS